MRKYSVQVVVGFACGALAACGGSSTKKDGSTGDGSRSGDLGANTGQLHCTGYTMPSFSKACSGAGDCAVASHQTDCCGNSRAIGIRAGELALFKAEEAKCAATYPGCGCPTGPPHTDDGSTVISLSGSGIGVDCVSGICTTYAKACGKVCPGGLSCHMCTVKTTIYAVCSKSCTLDTECTDPALPKCESDGFGGKFCTAGGVGCGTK